MIKYLFFTWTFIFLPLAGMHDKKLMALVEERINKKQNLNIGLSKINERKKSLLCLAAEKPENLVITLTLLENGANPNFKAKCCRGEGESPLSAAIRNKDVQTIQALLARGANPNEQSEHSKDTPLHKLCFIQRCLSTPEFEEREALIKSCLQHGANPNRKNRYGETPLFQLLQIQPNDACPVCNNFHFFNDNERQALISLLVKAGCDVFIKNKKGLTALNFASCSRLLFPLAKEAKQLYRRQIFKLLMIEHRKKGKDCPFAYIPMDIIKIIFKEVCK